MSISVVKALNISLFLSTQAAVERRNISRCPAVRFAASRNPKAIGWAIRLIVSIQTISGIRKEGVPWGTRWLRRLLKASKNPRIFTLNHRGIAILYVNDTCLVIVKAYGNSPIKLIDNIMKNIVEREEIQGAAFCLAFWNISFKASVRILFHTYIMLPAKKFVEKVKLIQVKAINEDTICSGRNLIVSGENWPNNLFIIFIFCYF